MSDVHNRKLLALVLTVSVDCLLDTGNETIEKIIETININGAVFGIVENPPPFLQEKPYTQRILQIYPMLMALFVKSSQIASQKA